MGGLLVLLATIELTLWRLRRPMLSHQRGWRRLAVLGAGAVLIAHVLIEGVRDDVAARASEEWRW